MYQLKDILQLTFFVFFPLILLGETEETEYPFPDEYSYQINQKINAYQEYNYAQTKKYTNKLLKHAEECEEEELILLSHTALEFYAHAFNKRGDFEKFTITADSVFKSIINNQNMQKYADYYFEHLNNYSVYLFRKNMINEADTLISNAIKLLEKNTFDQNTKQYYLPAFYQNLSSVKELQWNFSEGILLLEKASKLDSESYFSKAYINQNFSSYHQKVGNYYEALDFAKLAVENYKNNYLITPTQNYDIFYFLSLIKLSSLYVIGKETASAKACLRELKTLSLENMPLVRFKYYQTKALINLSENKPIKALKNYKKCINIQQNELSNRILEQAKINKSIAQIYHDQNQVDSSIYFLQQAIVLLTNDSSLNKIEDNPKQFQKVTHKQALIDILYSKADFILNNYEQNNDIVKLQLAMQTSQSAQNLAQKTRLELSSDSDKELFSKRGHKIYEQAMRIAALLEENEHAQVNLDFAYHTIESSRALLLAEAVYQSNTKEFAGIPKNIIIREDSFRVAILNYDRQIFLLEQKGVDAESYKAEKWLLQNNFSKFTETLKIDYPNYYNLKFAVEVPKRFALQEDLKTNNQTFIEYFLGEEYIYALITSANSQKLKSWSRPPNLTEKIKSLRNAIYAEKDYEIAPVNFVNNAHDLYQDLVKPLGDLPKRLVIVPDGVLNYIPFDALLTELPKYATSYQSHSYLLKYKELSYDYSATLRMQKRNEVQGKYNFMGFAPYYNQTNALATRQVGELKFNIEEVDYIQTLFGGHTFVGDAALKKKFIDQCDQATILHFAGHAVQEEINPDFSHLLFSKDTSNSTENQMHVREIYASNNNAQMVVLSACNTGLGQIQLGEGVYSLGRAFSYAGAQSLVSTLWSVNDKSTKEIMIYFYENLKEGMTKDNALREAKQKYIDNQTNVNSNPLYWAGFVAYGDMKELSLKTKQWWKFW